jgi:hypothetical protein
VKLKKVLEKRRIRAAKDKKNYVHLSLDECKQLEEHIDNINEQFYEMRKKISILTATNNRIEHELLIQSSRRITAIKMDGKEF